MLNNSLLPYQTLTKSILKGNPIDNTTAVPGEIYDLLWERPIISHNVACYPHSRNFLGRGIRQSVPHCFDAKVTLHDSTRCGADTVHPAPPPFLTWIHEALSVVRRRPRASRDQRHFTDSRGWRTEPSPTIRMGWDCFRACNPPSNRSTNIRIATVGYVRCFRSL